VPVNRRSRHALRHVNERLQGMNRASEPPFTHGSLVTYLKNRAWHNLARFAPECATYRAAGFHGLFHGSC